MSGYTIADLIEKKRDNGVLTKTEIEAFTIGSCDGTWKDYQIAAMLMAMFIRGLNAEETAHLTLAMAKSGDQYDLSEFGGHTVDKHSTGGVADTTTLIAAPLACACGVNVFKLSGKGLGFTGGTIDKLESIPGFNVGLSKNQAYAQVRNIGIAIMAQTDTLTPADKKFYALRDVTATVDNIPLIAASIMSKKIAGGADSIVLDVKCGSGAFMKDLDRARELANMMTDIGALVNRRTVAIISSMDQPLGQYIGNSLEVIEAIEVLKGNIKGDLLDVSIELAAQMLILGGKAKNIKDAQNKLLRALDSGEALDKLRQLIESQSGNSSVIENYSLFPTAKFEIEFKASSNGFISEMNTAEIGKAFVVSGGGRQNKEDSIDYAAGIILQKRLHEKVEQGDTIAKIRSNDKLKAEKSLAILSEAISIGQTAGKSEPVILDKIGI